MTVPDATRLLHARRGASRYVFAGSGFRKVPTNRIVSIARKAALRSRDRYNVGAVVYRGSRILGVGTNDMLKTSPLSFHAFKSRHAEFNAIRRAVGTDAFNVGRRECRISGASIYVHRVGRDGLDHCAKPCEACQKMIAWAEIKNVEWSE